MEKKAISKCRECGEHLYDGDTAYLIDGEHYCPACVTNSLVVCRITECNQFDSCISDGGEPI